MTPRVIFIYDSADQACIDELALHRDRLRDAAVAIQVRVHDGAARGDALLRLKDAGIPFIVNGAADEAVRAGATGVHLGGTHAGSLSRARATLGADFWISVPAHSDDDVSAAARDGASAVLVSPIFETPGKGPARGVGALTSARVAGSGLSIYALGGVDATNAASCIASGADGVAVIRAIADATRKVDALLDLDDRVRRILATRRIEC